MRKNKLLLLLLCFVLLISATACGGTDEPATSEEETGGETGGETAEETGGEGLGFKIGLVTDTVSQGEEEFRAAENMVAKYGADVIKHVTFPDNFMQEQETTIAQIAGLADDPDIKAIIVCQSVPGTVAAFEKIRETRDDILLIAGLPQEDAEIVADRADIVINTDDVQRGETIMRLAHEMGAKTFIHYSFPRHMSIDLLAQRRDVMKNLAAELGIEFVEVDAPDPTGDAGIPGAQQFILEDVPRQVEKYGKDTALFSTNCSMQEPLIKSVLSTGAMFPEQCCPSPYHGYPGALGIEIPEDKAGDLQFILDEIKSKVEEAGQSGRMATWKVPAAMAIIESAVEYGVLYGKGEVDGFNKAKLEEVMSEVVGDKIEFGQLGDLENYMLFISTSVIF